MFGIFFVLSILFVRNETARILAVYPTPSISHQVVFRQLTNELIRRGHEVLVITTDPEYSKGDAPINLTEIDVHEISYRKWREYLATTSSDDNDLQTQTKVAFPLISEIFYHQMRAKEVEVVFEDKSKKFDLLLFEAYVKPVVALTHVLNIRAIQVSSFGAIMGIHGSFGAPVHPLLYPTSFRQRIYNLTFWEKLRELYNHYQLMNLMQSFESADNILVKRLFGPDIPDIKELMDNVDLLFLNTNPIWESNRPVPPAVIYMGGLHQKPVKELPKDLKNYLDSSTKGVIYMSFGTNVAPSQLPSEKIKLFLKVFSELPYNVLWKWDQDDLPGKSKNIRVSKWLPQSDLLRHHNVKLFITQGGLQSTDEAITAGVPLIGIPMLGDQWYNVEHYTYHRIGLRLDMNVLTEDALRKAIYTILGDDSYRQNVIRLRNIVKDEPMKPLDRAVWWIEYVIRHGGAKHFRSPAANMSWAEFLELKFIATLLLLVFAVLSIFGYFVFLLVKLYRKYQYVVRIKIKRT
ncbi:hypothetical protein ACJJTC_001943 [Scirpophaga incertulas]